MKEPSVPRPETDLTMMHQRVEQLAHSNEGLRCELTRLQQISGDLKGRLRSAQLNGTQDREARSAALNLMEDALQARLQLQQANRDLEDGIARYMNSENALHKSERALEAAQVKLRQLQVEFEERVHARTAQLSAREERLNSLATRLQRAEQDERQRLARLLHDHVQQLLVAAQIRLDAMASNLDEQNRAELTAVMALLTEAVQASRDVAVQLTPPLLHDQGLPAALAWLIARLEKQQRLHVAAAIDEDANPASAEQRDILFQAAHEFLLNVAKHAGTAEADLRLERAQAGIRLEVSDRGSGFSMKEANSAGGSFGLLRIGQRLESVGGALTVESAPKNGTSIAAMVPVNGAPVNGAPVNGVPVNGAPPPGAERAAAQAPAGRLRDRKKSE